MRSELRVGPAMWEDAPPPVKQFCTDKVLDYVQTDPVGILNRAALTPGGVAHVSDPPPRNPKERERWEHTCDRCGVYVGPPRPKQLGVTVIATPLGVARLGSARASAEGFRFLVSICTYCVMVPLSPGFAEFVDHGDGTATVVQINEDGEQQEPTLIVLRPRVEIEADLLPRVLDYERTFDSRPRSRGRSFGDWLRNRG